MGGVEVLAGLVQWYTTAPCLLMNFMPRVLISMYSVQQICASYIKWAICQHSQGQVTVCFVRRQNPPLTCFIITYVDCYSNSTVCDLFHFMFRLFSGRDLAADVGCHRILAEEDSWDSLTRILTDLRKEQTTSVSSALKIFSTLMIEGFWKKNYELNNNRLIKFNLIQYI